MKDWADGQMLRSRIAKIRGRARCTGFAGVNPGDVLKVSGVGRGSPDVLVTAGTAGGGSGDMGYAYSVRA